MPYVELHLNWTGITPEDLALQVRSRNSDDYYWRYSGGDGLLFSALYYPSPIEICRYNFGLSVMDFATDLENFEISHAALRDFINFAADCQAVVSEGHLRDVDWLIPFQNNDFAVLQRNLWQRAAPKPQSPPLPANIGLYQYIGQDSNDWIKITRDFIKEQAAFARLAELLLKQGLEVAIIRQETE